MKRLVTAVAILGFVPASTAAQITDYSGRALQTQEYLNFVSVGGSPTSLFTGSFVGPYLGEFTTAPYPTTPQFSLISVDYSNYAGDQFVNVIDLGAADVGSTRLGAGSYTNYQAAAYLGSLFDSWQDYLGGTYPHKTLGEQPFHDRKSIFSGIQAAIWTIMTAGSINHFPYGSTSPGVMNSDLAAGVADPFLRLSLQNAAGFNTDGWYVLSPTTISGSTVEERLRDGGEEFLVRTNVVPEPSTFVLLGTGLFLLVAFGRKRLVGREDIA